LYKHFPNTTYTFHVFASFLFFIMDGVEIGWLAGGLDPALRIHFLATPSWLLVLAPGSGSTMHYLTGATPSWLLDGFPVCDVIAVQR